jgi:hypothetical protein
VFVVCVAIVIILFGAAEIVRGPHAVVSLRKRERGSTETERGREGEEKE